MSVTIELKGQRFAELPLTTTELMREIGLLARERILRRTAQSLDVNGAPFQPYSATYAIAKAKEVGSGPVNLQLSGGMLGALVITEVTATSVTLGFSS
jgi:hypothetical protein